MCSVLRSSQPRQSLNWPVSCGDRDRGSPTRQVAARGVSIQRGSVLVRGETLSSLVSSAILRSSESPEHPLLADSLARTEAGMQGNQQRLSRAEGLFPAATGVSISSSQHGTSLTDFLHSVFQATVLFSASIWGC